MVYGTGWARRTSGQLEVELPRSLVQEVVPTIQLQDAVPQVDLPPRLGPVHLVKLTQQLILRVTPHRIHV